MKLFRLLLLAAAALALPGLLGSCVYDQYPETGTPDDDAAYVTLLLHVATASPTRANAPSQERMHSLRVVLVDAVTDAVEYNAFIDRMSASELLGNGDGVEEVDYAQFRLIRTLPGRKQLYLIANEESVAAVNGATGQSLTALLDGKQVGDTGFGTLVNSLYFTPDFDEPLVLSSSYDFEILPSDFDPVTRRVERTFWLVHAATKFQFDFENIRPDAVRIDALTISSLAGNQGTGDMYLMANLAEEEKTKTLDGEPLYWIEWLRRVCDDTTAHPELPDNGNINERYGWISDYTLPAGTGHAVTDVKQRLGGGEADWTIGAEGGKLSLPDLYCAESKFVPAGEAAQRYTFSLTLTDTGLDGEEATKRFEQNELANLKALFRNTCVKVTVVIKQAFELDLRIGVCAWDREEVDIPTFD